MHKLRPEHKHIMRLIVRDADAEGWVKVSEMLYSTLSKALPPELVVFEKKESGGRARLTHEGEAVFRAMEWL